MKKFLYSILIAAASLGFTATVQAEEKETVKVCVDVKDKAGNPVKDAKGNVKQNCKVMPAHKKLEGTKIPEKK